MHPEKYCLTWDTYSEHLKDMVKEMMNDDLADVTLVTEDKKHMRAHKNILSACSQVFKDIVKLEQSSKPIIFLRGINFSDLESIMQFIYFGEATFYEERMNEFLAVARSLEIKQLCEAQTETNDDEELSQSDLETSTENLAEETIRSSQFMNQTPRENMIRDRREVVRVNGRYECDQCEKTFGKTGNLYTHIQSVHEGVRYACDKCDSQFTLQRNLKQHIDSKHEGVKYACDQCDYQASQRNTLKIHIESKHEGVKYACDQCDYQATAQFNLVEHIKTKHEGIRRYACDQCNYKATKKESLKYHKLSKHKQ